MDKDLGLETVADYWEYIIDTPVLDLNIGEIILPIIIAWFVVRFVWGIIFG